MMEHSDTGGVVPIEKYLTRKQVADIFGVHVMTVGRWIAAGKLRATSNGHRWYISPAAVREFAAENEAVARGCLTSPPLHEVG